VPGHLANLCYAHKQLLPGPARNPLAFLQNHSAYRPQYAQPARVQHLAVLLCGTIQQLRLRFGLPLLLGPALLLGANALILAKPYT